MVPKALTFNKVKILFFECLVCIEEHLRRNIFTDFASIKWLTGSFGNIYIPTHYYLPPRIFGPSCGPEMNVVVMASDVARLRVPKASET